jgi:hypothetical protein
MDMVRVIPLVEPLVAAGVSKAAWDVVGELAAEVPGGVAPVDSIAVHAGPVSHVAVHGEMVAIAAEGEPGVAVWTVRREWVPVRFLRCLFLGFFFLLFLFYVFLTPFACTT